MTEQATNQGRRLAPVTVRWTFGDRMRKIRRSAGMSSRDFAAALGITNSGLAQWETDRSLPRHPVDVAHQVYWLTGVEPAWLLRGCCAAHSIAVPETEMIVRPDAIQANLAQWETELET